MKLFRKQGCPVSCVGRALEFAVLRASLAALRILPGPVARTIGDTAGAAAGTLFRWHRNRAIENLEQAFPERPPQWARRTASACFRHFGRAIAEAAHAPVSGADPRWKEILSVPDEARVLSLLAEGRGLIWVGGHLGNWEFAATWAARHGLDLASVAHGSRNPRLDAFIQRERALRGNTSIRIDGAFRNLIRALKGGGMVALLTDRNPRDSGVLVPFFGREILTVTTPALLSCVTGAPILPFSCVRDGDRFRYVLRFADAIRPDPAAPRGDEVLRITRAHTAALEQFIRETPEQWQWMHRRWKITPGGRKRAGVSSREPARACGVGQAPAISGR